MKTKIINDVSRSKVDQAAPKTESRTTIDFKSEKFLHSLLSKAMDKGYTTVYIVCLCVIFDHLEIKYSKGYEELKNDFEQLGVEIAAKSRKVEELEEAISAIQKKKADTMREYGVDEKSVKEYVEARAKLSTIGLRLDEFPKIKTFLFSIKNEDYDPNTVIQKLNTISDLEGRKSAIEARVADVNGDLQEKKVLLIQLRQLLHRGMTVEQIERLRDLVSKISSRRGINADQAMNHFQEDVVKYYDLSLGLEGDVMRLQETKNSLSSEFEE